MTSQTAITPEVIPMHGAPCAGCGRPAHEVRVYPAGHIGRVVVHRGERQGSCTVTGLIGGAS